MHVRVFYIGMHERKHKNMHHDVSTNMKNQRKGLFHQTETTYTVLYTCRHIVEFLEEIDKFIELIIKSNLKRLFNMRKYT
jgi:hypothetical protein